ncbi:MAG: DNA recombination protein RmuC [Eubacterium sp.]|jgi:DNA recombination protein RmuC|nr:DNA recombination protein RmuC [Eubacterium sp.]
MEIAILIVLIFCAVALVIILIKQFEYSHGEEIFSNNLLKNISDMDKNIVEKQAVLNNSILNQLKQFEERLKSLELTSEQKLEAMRNTISSQLSLMQSDNGKKLDEIRITVDEKLQKTLEEKMDRSFKLVSERLEEVYKGLGEMQNLAVGVGDLKKVLSNVKTRGILGEIQLGAILSEILTQEQYDTEVPTSPDSKDRVEFAIKLPAETGGHIYLPVDSKFPGDSYATLQDSYASGDAEAVKAAYKNLESVIKKSAKDIYDKYISPPYTTNFAIMFLPFEGLYAEAVNHGLVEILQREYNVNIAGPSTMAALLNSLQMGFKTLQIQKRSSDVWKILGAVKAEFQKFEDALSSAKNRIRQLDDDLDKLIGVRTRGINRRLREVEQLDENQSELIMSGFDE